MDLEVLFYYPDTIKQEQVTKDQIRGGEDYDSSLQRTTGTRLGR